MTKLQAVWEDGKLVIKGPQASEADCYIAVKGKQFAVVPTLQQAEEFGGRIYFITHYQHNDETLPQSHFLKEV